VTQIVKVKYASTMIMVSRKRKSPPTMRTAAGTRATQRGATRRTAAKINRPPMSPSRCCTAIVNERLFEIWRRRARKAG